MSIEAFLAGTWQISFQGQDGPETIETTFQKGGTCTMVDTTQMADGPLVVHSEGVWAVDAGNGDNAIQLTFTPSTWDPQEYCPATGPCKPIRMNAFSVDAQIIDRDTIETDSGNMIRVR